MSADTSDRNKLMRYFDDHDEVWLFGYGSLIYKVDFSYIERRPASITGWARRFWQGSHDHRGTPEAPGRVATLIAQRDSICPGMAYLITPLMFEQLDIREKNGYLRVVTTMHFDDGGEAQGVVYIANEDNEAWLGPAPERDIAHQIACSHGPSGPNRDYLLKLAASLRELGHDDEHVFALERHLQALELNEN